MECRDQTSYSSWCFVTKVQQVSNLLKYVAVVSLNLTANSNGHEN